MQQPESTGHAPRALARKRPLPSADDLAERVAICAEAEGSNVARIRQALLWQSGFDDEAAFADAHRQRLVLALDTIAPVTAPQGTLGRLLKVSQAFLASPWFALAIRHGWSDCELFGVSWEAPPQSFAAGSLVASLALACPAGFKLTAIDESTAILCAEPAGRLIYRRFARNTASPWFTLAARPREIASAA